MKYEKPPLTYQQQIELLKSRGLVFDDESKAESQLSNVSYYRLSAYMLPFKKNMHGEIVNEFRYGTTWKDVYNLYVFDRKLRLLVFDAIEKIEVAIRCQLICTFAQIRLTLARQSQCLESTIYEDAEQWRSQDHKCIC